MLLGLNITLEKSLDPTAGEVDVFPQEITRVLLNLISNGFYAATMRKAEANGGNYEPTLAAATKNLGDSIEIRIRDNGTGIPPEVKEKMFNPFFTTKPVGEGTGLGLSISHDIIVKQHGGSIEVNTRPGEFTEFRIVLPRGAATIAKSGEHTENLLILVVDDEPDVEVLFRQQFRHDLRADRFTMEFAQSAPAALQRITDAAGLSIILILSDINMPGMSGLELLPKAKAMRPDVPIIMITALWQLGDKASGTGERRGGPSDQADRFRHAPQRNRYTGSKCRITAFQLDLIATASHTRPAAGSQWSDANADSIRLLLCLASLAAFAATACAQGPITSPSASVVDTEIDSEWPSPDGKFAFLTSYGEDLHTIDLIDRKSGKKLQRIGEVDIEPDLLGCPLGARFETLCR